MTTMKTRIIIIAAILSCLTCFNMRGQVKVREANQEVPTIFNALSYIADNTVDPDTDGVIHIDVIGNVTEPSIRVAEEDRIVKYTTTPGGVTQTVWLARFNISDTNIKKIVISSDDTKSITIAKVTYPIDYLVKMAYSNAELEVSNLKFEVVDVTSKAYFSWIVSSSSGTHKTRTYFHDCVFIRGCHMQTNAIPSSDLSDTFEFYKNEWQDLDDYIFHIEGGTDEEVTTNLIFTENYIESFRAVSAKAVNYGTPNSLKRIFNVTFDGNKFYHLFNYGDGTRKISSAVSLFQMTGPLNGEYVFINNIILGHFTAKGEDSDQKSCAMILQHGGGKYQGVVDGSSFTLKNNTLQCDVYPIGWKEEKSSEFDTFDVTESVAGGDYYNHESQSGDYDSSISPATIVHMYPEEGNPHDEDDDCHVCGACGQIVVHAEVSGNGGTFDYLDENNDAQDVNSAITTIAHNLYPSDIQLGKELIDFVVDDIEKDGLCLDPKEYKIFVITPLLPNTFQSLSIYGRDPVKVLETGAEGLIFLNDQLFYTFTNDFKQTNRYSTCPKLVAKFGYGSIKITCNGLSAGESALFDVKDGSGNVKFIIKVSSENPSKVVSGLTAGTYKVAPHDDVSGKNWQWTYGTNDEKTVVVEDGTEKTAIFSVTKKTGITTKNGEDYIDNELSSGTASGGLTSVSNWKKGASYNL